MERITELFDPNYGARQEYVLRDGSRVWLPARACPLYDFGVRLREAWEVLRYRADALKWE